MVEMPFMMSLVWPAGASNPVRATLSNLGFVALANRYTSKLTPGFSLSSHVGMPELVPWGWKQSTNARVLDPPVFSWFLDFRKSAHLSASL